MANQEETVREFKEFMEPACLRGHCPTRPVIRELNGDYLCGRHLDVFLALCRDVYDELAREQETPTP
jgi:hypothetical protein